ncbi:FAD binding domain of DNA photolyase family protein, partial [Vibrio parahaemolyticus EKP-028]
SLMPQAGRTSKK